MKKLISLITILCIFSVPAFAEELDLSRMTLYDLERMRDAVIAEINSRPMDESDMPEEAQESLDLSQYALIEKGSEGDTVKALQERLAELHYLKDDADGKFGGNTQAAVEEFQEINHLEVTGIATPETQALLFSDKAIERTLYVAVPKSSSEIELFLPSMIAKGYSSDEAEELIRRKNSGEALHPFHLVEYDSYNSPAEENGFEGDTILAYGRIRKYVKDGGKNSYVQGFTLEQNDGDKWLISFAFYENGVLVGHDYASGSEKKTVFDGYEGEDASIYGKYLGYSEKYQMPVIDISLYGGMLLHSTNTFIETMTAGHNMDNDGLHDLGYLLGADRYIDSTERYRLWK